MNQDSKYKDIVNIVRNSGFGFIGLGLIFVPEVFNPYLYSC